MSEVSVSITFDDGSTLTHQSVGEQRCDECGRRIINGPVTETMQVDGFRERLCNTCLWNSDYELFHVLDSLNAWTHREEKQRAPREETTTMDEKEPTLDDVEPMLFTFDHDEDPARVLGMIQRAQKDLYLYVNEVPDTGADIYAIYMSPKPLDVTEPQQLWDEWQHIQTLRKS